MNIRTACAVLGVHDPFTASDVEIAFKRTVRLSHPDTGGVGGDLARVRAARDVLLKSLGSECKACKGKGAVGGFTCKTCKGRGK